MSFQLKITKNMYKLVLKRRRREIKKEFDFFFYTSSLISSEIVPVFTFPFFSIFINGVFFIVTEIVGLKPCDS